MNKFQQFLEELPKFQSQIVNKEEAIRLHKLQINALHDSIENGLKLLESFESTKSSGDPACDEFLSALNIFHHKIQTNLQAFYDAPNTYEKEQRTLYEYLDSESISTEHQLFFELLIGYCRFDAVIQSSRIFFAFLNKKYEKNYSLPKIESADTFFKRLENVSDAAKILYENIADCYDNGEKAFEYWQDTERFFKENSNLSTLMSQWFSIQHKPKDMRVVSLAQMLHFNGNGGNFEMLHPFKQLAPLAHNALSIHGAQGEALEKFDKLAMFKPIYIDFAGYTYKILAAYLNAEFSGEALVNVYDFGSGSTCNGVMPAIKASGNLQCQLTASDVDFHNVENIWNLEMPENCRLSTVRFDDLNLDLKVQEEDKNHYHLTSTSIVMHQLFPKDKDKVIRYLLNLTKPGGLISNPDAGLARTFHQAYILPANSDDREGGVVWSGIKSTYITADEPGYIKIAFPLHALAYPKEDCSPYVCQLYRVILLKESALDELDQALQSKNLKAAYQLVKTHSLNQDDLLGFLEKCLNFSR